jgi:hypothetical protein
MHSESGLLPMMVFLYVEPKWRNLRGEPRVVRLLKRMKFP